MKDEENKFSYTYSAPTQEERREIEEIRGAYLPPSAQEEGLLRLRKLHKRVNRVPVLVGILLGVCGVLVFGLGMALTLEFGQYGWGIGVSLIGAAVTVGAYFAHRALLAHGRRKYGAEILRLSEELLHDEREE